MFSNYYRNKKVLVTGHTGFKGSWLCQWLLKLGAEVMGVSNEIPTSPSHFTELGLDEKIDHILCDIRNYNELNKHIEKFDPDVIIHLAAQALVAESYEDPLGTISTNVMGTANLLHSISKRENTKQLNVVIITSDKCYENVEWIWGYREVDRLGGKDPYSASKACAEVIFSSFSRTILKDKNVNLVSVRAGNVIGGGDWSENRLVVDCVKSWSKGDKLKIRSPEATRPWQHVLEPLSGYLLVGSKAEYFKGESFNFGPLQSEDKTVGMVIEDLYKVFSNKDDLKFNHEKSNMHEAGLLRLNCDKAQSLLNWKATLSYEQTIDFVGVWYKEFYSGNKNIREITEDQINSYERIAKCNNLVWTI